MLKWYNFKQWNQGLAIQKQNIQRQDVGGKESVDMCSHVVSFDRDDGLSLLNIDFPIDMSFGWGKKRSRYESWSCGRHKNVETNGVNG